MAKTYYTYLGKLIDYVKGQGIKDPHMNATFTDGNILSTPCEQLQWIQALLAGKVIKDKKYLKEFLSENPNEYAFGLFRYQVDGNLMLNHAGAWLGFQNYFLYDSTEKKGFVFATNYMEDEDYKNFLRDVKRIVFP